MIAIKTIVSFGSPQTQARANIKPIRITLDMAVYRSRGSGFRDIAGPIRTC